MSVPQTAAGSCWLPHVHWTSAEFPKCDGQSPLLVELEMLPPIGLETCVGRLALTAAPIAMSTAMPPVAKTAMSTPDVRVVAWVPWPGTYGPCAYGGRCGPGVGCSRVTVPQYGQRTRLPGTESSNGAPQLRQSVGMAAIMISSSPHANATLDASGGLLADAENGPSQAPACGTLWQPTAERVP